MIHTILLASAIILLSIIILILITGNYKRTPIMRNFYVLGTIVQLKVFGRKAEKAIDEVVERLNDIDNKMSVFKVYSEISNVNINAGKAAQVVSEDTYFVLKNAVKYSKISEGAFDPTIGPIVDLWGIGTDNARIPEENEIEEKLPLVNYNDIILNEDESSIMLSHQGQSIDVGGIAKGYAADEVKNIFLKRHIKDAIIDLGGNIFALGSKGRGNPWKVGIQNPFKPRGEYVGILSVKNKSIVTSGNYERFFIEGQNKFHHIIDPRTGYPSESKVVSATIISDKSIDGDGLSTGVYIMGLEKAFNLIESLKGIDAIFITDDKKVYSTSGVKENFTLQNHEFNYEKGAII